ncbi:hypothetical protein BXZ70DRAFT_107136 [Cristinia sonorae]|uniref:MYND-type domain-containing protein n=1 Tax=Cristinia sonorae TaxID=1940300 RepID=A0A8K0UQ56_9AGAR|nr:hypothetical protein BXZ70DRAFT_107136 [Cristinia sonorae]
MLGRQQEIQRAASFEPRAHLEGINLPAGFKLPSLSVVRSEAQQLPEVKRTGPGEIRTVYVGSDGKTSSNGNPPPPLPEPLAWNHTFPNLFKFSYFARTEDVPVDLLEDVIFILKMFIRVLTESTEKQLRNIGHVLPHQKVDIAKYFMLSNARYKLVEHLMCQHIDRPEEALPVLEAVSQQHVNRLKQTGIREDPVQNNPLLYSMYSTALTFTKQFTEQTKTMLEGVLKAATHSALATNTDMKTVIVRAHMNLSLVLKQMNVEPVKQMESTEWAVKWVRKNGKRLGDLEQFVRRSDLPPHPVYVALGAGWFESYHEGATTAKEDDRLSKRCRTCGLTEPQVKLSRCAGCQHIFYCSKECQKQNWKLHKDSCKEVGRAKAHAEALKAEDPQEGQKASDWIKWRDGSHYANTHALAHALGLHRDPSRGRTHIVFRFMEYTPKASKDIRHKFRVSHAGVFRIQDVLTDIEGLMGLDPGEGREYIDGLLADVTRGENQVPILDMSVGDDGIDPYLGSIAIPLSMLRSSTYDPNWRKSINMGDPAEPVALRCGAKDVEHVF